MYITYRVWDQQEEDQSIYFNFDLALKHFEILKRNKVDCVLYADVHNDDDIIQDKPVYSQAMETYDSVKIPV